MLESINPARSPLLKRQRDRQNFEQQTRDNYASLVEDELSATVFLDGGRLDEALRVTHLTDGGAEALQRFDAVADPQAYYEKTHG